MADESQKMADAVQRNKRSLASSRKVLNRMDEQLKQGHPKQSEGFHPPGRPTK